MSSVAGVLVAVVLALTASACSDGSTPSSSAPTGAGSSSSAPPTSASTTSGPATSTPAAPTPPTSTQTTSTPPAADPRVAGVVSSGLAVPWGIAFLPDGSALATERDTAAVVLIPAGGGPARTVGKVPGVEPDGEAGLLGVALSPAYAADHLVYVYFTAAADNRVARLTFDGTSLGRPEVLLSGIHKANHHDGGRLAFGPDGMLYVSTGDAGETGTAQDRGSLNGKILRLTPDGKPAPGNPFGDSPVWSYGHRNVQGLAWDAAGRMWASEFGQDTWDELNLIVKGQNYGWPVVEGPEQHTGFALPVAWWHTDDASPSGIAVAGNAVWLGALKGERLWRVPLLAGGKVGAPRAFFQGRYGRLRAVATAPDGSLWVGTSNRDGRGSPHDGDDQILRVVLG